MANPTGKNSPEQFGGFGTQAPYGSKKKAAQLQKSAPMAGQGASGHALGTPRRATELAIAQAGRNKKTLEQARQPAAAPAPKQQAPLIPEAVQVVQPDVSAQTWAQVAADPQASELVRVYAQQAATA